MKSQALGTDHGAHVSRTDQPAHPDLTGVEDGPDDRRAELVHRENVVVADAFLLCLKDRGGHRGRGGLEAHTQEHHLSRRILPGYLKSVQRRVDDAHVGALGPRLLQAGAAAGDLEHVPERGQDDFGEARQGNGLVQIGVVRHAYRAAGAGEHLDGRGKKLSDAVPHDGDRVSAAELHEADVFGGTPVDACQSAPGPARNCGSRRPASFAAVLGQSGHLPKHVQGLFGFGSDPGR